MTSIGQKTQELLEKYLDGSYTESEFELLRELLKVEVDSDVIEELLLNRVQKSKSHPLETEIDWPAMLDRILGNEVKKNEVDSPVRSLSLHKRTAVFWRVAAAAAVILVVVALGYFYSQSPPVERKVVQVEKPVRQILPGGDKAVLTLADGRQVVLDSAGNGAVAKQGGITVINLDGQLAYQPEGQSTEVLYNTVTTPRGGQYQLVLADGSKVWLNAASSLRFPTGFPGSERTVELMGEGYFEVAHNAAKPFHVRVLRYAQDDNPMDVQVLGTHFNINSYGDEPAIKTTLLEGRVRVEKTQNHVFLNPGQQAVVSAGNGDIRIQYDADVNEAIAWKNGRFVFNSADVKTIMRQIARWYDLTVLYEGKIGTDTYSGVVGRDANITQVLKIMEEGGVHFEMDNKSIIVRQ
ncbi:MAG: FecR family protein [Flavisolibacter sp.]